MELGRVGIWSGLFRARNRERSAEAARRVESLGFGALWIPGGAGGEIFDECANALEATEHLVVATGILNIWAHQVAETAAGHAALQRRFPGRFLLGLGVSHAVMVESMGASYEQPLTAMRDYLDGLDTAEPPVPPDERALAALGPKMLELSRDRSLGAHPYFVTPEHTAVARGVLGPDALLAPEQMVVLDTDPDSARAVARQSMAIYLDLPNYTNNLRRLGWGDEDLAAPGSDRLVDAIVAWGTPGQIAERVAAHHEAGADHVCLQVLSEDPRAAPIDAWAQLGDALIS